MNRILTGIVLALAPAHGAQAAEIACVTPVDVIGIEQTIRAHDYTPVAWLKNAPLTEHMVGYGMGAGREFEISIVDGTYRFSHVADGAVTMGDTIGDLGAATLVRADPGTWTEGDLLTDIWDLASLNIAVSDLARAKGCEGDMTIPFRITGLASEVKWSVYGQPAKVFGSLEDVEVVLVGLYSNHDKANTFLSAGYSLRAEMHVPATGFGGEVVEIALDDGALIQLPAAN